MTALFPFMKQLVTSGKYDVTGDDGKNEKHKGEPTERFGTLLHRQ